MPSPNCLPTNLRYLREKNKYPQLLVAKVLEITGPPVPVTNWEKCAEPGYVPPAGLLLWPHFGRTGQVGPPAEEISVGAGFPRLGRYRRPRVSKTPPAPKRTKRLMMPTEASPVAI